VSTAACILQDKTHRPGVSVALDVEMLADVGESVAFIYPQHTQTFTRQPISNLNLPTPNIRTHSAPGAKVRLSTWADRVGKTLAFCRLDLRDDATGTLVAVGKHCKYLPMGIPFWDAAFNPGLYPILRCVLDSD
jgi:hypothetical protein